MMSSTEHNDSFQADPQRGSLETVASPVHQLRSCIVCRLTLPRSGLLTVSVVHGVVVPEKCEKPSTAGGLSKRLGGDALLGKIGGKVGKGTYVCIARSCIDKITPAMVLSRTHKKSAFSAKRDRQQNTEVLESPPREDFCATTHRIAEHRILAAIGLARRANTLQSGASQALADNHHGKLSLLLCGSDAAERTRRRAEKYGARTFLDSTRLGDAAGLHDVAVMRIRAGKLATDATYWMSVWEATRSITIHRETGIDTVHTMNTDSEQSLRVAMKD